MSSSLLQTENKPCLWNDGISSHILYTRLLMLIDCNEPSAQIGSCRTMRPLILLFNRHAFCSRPDAIPSLHVDDLLLEAVRDWGVGFWETEEKTASDHLNTCSNMSWGEMKSINQMLCYDEQDYINSWMLTRMGASFVLRWIKSNFARLPRKKKQLSPATWCTLCFELNADIPTMNDNANVDHIHHLYSACLYTMIWM